MVTKQPTKYYVITHGASRAFIATVHSADCPLLPQMKHAKEKNFNPLDNDRRNHYSPCQRCIGKAKAAHPQP